MENEREEQRLNLERQLNDFDQNPPQIEQKPHPLTTMWFLPRIFFFWCNDIIKTCRKTPWTQEMNYKLPEYEKVSNHKHKILANYNRKKNLVTSILSTYKQETLFIMIAVLINNIVSAYGTKYMATAIKSLSSLSFYHNFDNVKTVAIKLLLGSLINIGTTIAQLNFQLYARRVSLAVRSSLFSIMQDKIMEFSTLNSNTVTQGFITDLIQVDVVFLNQMYYQLYQIFGAIVGTGTYLVFMAILVGFYQTLILLGILLVLLVLFYIAYQLGAYIRKKYLEAKDKRMSLLRNVMENIDYVKINGMENYFCLEMYERREGEIFWLKVQAVLIVLRVGLLELVGKWIPVTVFNAIWLFYPKAFEMNLSKFYQFYQYNGQLSSSLFNIYTGYNYYLKMMVSVRRINRFLLSAESRKNYLKEFSGEGDLALKFHNGNFKWRFAREGESENDNNNQARVRDTENLNQNDNNLRGGSGSLLSNVDDSDYDGEGGNSLQKVNEFTLQNIDLSIRRGEKIGVIGRSSSGTSSLLYAMIGEMIPIGSAKVLKNGTISFMSQSRWLMGSSIKENILLGKPFDAKLMRMSLEAADLLADLEQFTNGIETIISDNGDSVSGGQKARIALARCFYQDTDIMILDDPTSSLDNKVTVNILEQLNTNPRWNQKTYIISTRKINILSKMDKVIFMEGGKVLFFGPYSQLMHKKEFQDYSQTQKIEEEQQGYEEAPQPTQLAKDGLNKLAKEEAKEERQVDDILARNDGKEDTNFFMKEDRRTGNISLALLHRTIRSTLGYPWVITALVLSYFTQTWSIQLVKLDYAWGNAYYNKKNPHNDPKILEKFYLIFFLYMFVQMLCIFPGHYSVSWFGRKVHSNMVFKLLHSKPTEFLQRTPNGVILNRFSNDVNNMDNNFVINFNGIIITFMNFLVLLITIVIGLDVYITLIPLILFLVLGFFLRNWYMSAQREVTRLMFISKSPVIGTAVSSIAGSSVIRIHQKEEYFQKKIDHLIDENSKNFLMNYGCNSWYFTLQSIFNSFILNIPLYAILLNIQYGSKISSKKASSDVQFISGFGTAYFYTLALTTILEQSMISIERLNKYENLESEDGYLNIKAEEKLFRELNNSKLKKARNYLQKKNANRRVQLVNQGRITLNHVSARYPTAQKNCLSDLNIEIPVGQTVGIVGRSGAGKSSFIKLLWRALDPSLGSVEVDSKDISSFDVKEYRREINVILQKPNIFQGTLMSNITQVQLSSAEIQAVREELIELGFPKSKLQERDLSYEVKESGSNLSQSEKQIICLMQALQIESKIVILDEATAYVDIALEKKFQERLYSKFKDSTLLIIAHRISNVMEADRVLVFDQGRIVEDGAPKELVKDSNSIFNGFYRA